MKKQVMISGVIGLILGIIFAQLFMPNISPMWGGNQSVGRIDADFIEQMIPHHRDAIIMANLALVRAEHSEIKTLAKNIVKAQSEEIAWMKQWYKTWFGKEVPGLNSSTGSGMAMMPGAMMQNMTDIASLKSAKPFDREFIRQMIPHHQMAVMMAQMLERSTNRPGMKQLAASIISAQTTEISQMREWYDAWYGR